ncbi:MAG: RsmE family RNA methyltransferase [Planctomycetota bacterium]
MSLKPAFIIEKYITEDKVKIASIFFNKIKNVLKKRIGDEIILLDGKGAIFTAILEKVDKEEIIARIIKMVVKRNNQISITCAYSIPKGSRHDILVEKLTEIGINELLPVKFHNSIKYKFDSKTLKFKRIERIIVSALTQSLNPVKPVLRQMIEFQQLIDLSKNYKFKVFGSLKSNIFLNKVLEEKLGKVESILYTIGPEGGFTDEETTIMVNNDFIPVKLTSTVLRIETAAILLGGIIVTTTLI